MSITPEDSAADSVGPTRAQPETPPGDNGRGGVFSLSFLALVATQFFVSLNDNMFRWLVVPIGKELIGKSWGEMPEIVRALDEAGRPGAVAGVGVFHVAVSDVCRAGRLLGRSLQQAQRDGRSARRPKSW